MIKNGKNQNYEGGQKISVDFVLHSPNFGVGASIVHAILRGDMSSDEIVGSSGFLMIEEPPFAPECL